MAWPRREKKPKKVAPPSELHIFVMQNLASATYTQKVFRHGIFWQTSINGRDVSSSVRTMVKRGYLGYSKNWNHFGGGRKLILLPAGEKALFDAVPSVLFEELKAKDEAEPDETFDDADSVAGGSDIL